MIYDELLKLETSKQSPHSPGIIQNNELVARLLVPEYIDDDGQVLASAFSHSDISVLRCIYDFESNKNLTIKQLLSNPKNIYKGYITAKICSLRNITYENLSSRLCYVIDSATKDKIGHADIKKITKRILNNTNIVLSEKRLKKFIESKILDVFDKEIKQ
ncbi:hypothetical protein BN3087_380008 [Sulfurovum sp. enrichment culture clone C5]|uniref:Uncharacterized protein n=1 Tax=Sulfurovum sp. enrichment culture clone C5 TaxID=497650 RepID=A0A0S4XMG2_9BACT|nr:hypothetical protein BN3087_380008 [Sulfurovum sp. enrichment culture clone C5]